MPAVSVAQQRFMGMVRAAQKGKLKDPSPSVARAAKSLSTQDAHDFAATKHKGLPQHVEKDASMNFAEQMAAPVKEAYVKLNPTDRVASKPRVRNNFQTPPAIGQPKPGPLTPPATQDAQKMVMRSAPSVPNPIVPPAQSGEPLKLASCIMPAPRYTAGAKKGKKPMPQPHARQLKTKQASHITFAQQMASGIEKKALGGLGTTIGAVGGLATAPTGHRMEGVGRGVGQGLGWDIGAGLGGGLGAVGGGMALPALLQLIASARGQQADPQSLANATGAGIVGGGLTGIVGGGMLGRSAAKGMMGAPTWQDEDTQRKATAANMAAP